MLDSDKAKKVFPPWINTALIIAGMSVAFYGGIELGEVKTRLEFHESLYFHAGAGESFVPRIELEQRLKRLDKRIKDLE